jgi:hypothetical protein
MSPETDRIIYFYRRKAEFGYDQISFCCFTETQADALLRDAVNKPEEWELHHSKSIYNECEDDGAFRF